MNDLDRAIETLYQVFAAYEADDLSEAETCMSTPVLKGVRRAVLAKPLESLGAEDLLDYYFLAVDHIGDADDLRHFLPRLLELIVATDGDFLGPEHLPALLASAGAAAWPAHERQAIVSFARAAAHLLPPEIQSELRELCG